MANQKITNPPDVDVMLDILRREFDETDLHELSEDEELEDSDDEYTTHTRSKPKKKPARFDSQEAVPETPVAEPNYPC
jgi:hypothetical protein